MLETREAYHISLKAFIKNDQGQVLVLEALDDGTYGGYHDFPGGRIEKDEFNTPVMEILQREVEEEVGLVGVVINPRPVAVSRHLILSKHTIEKTHDVPVFYVFYEAQYSSGDLKISSEHKNVKWLKLEDIDLEKYFTSGILEAVKIYLNK